MATERTAVPGLARTAGLPSPPPRKPSVAPAPPAPARHESPAPAPSTNSSPRPATARRGRKVERASENFADDAQIPVNLSLPTKMCTQTRAFCKDKDVTIATTLMDAIVFSQDQLPDLIQALKRKESNDGLFVRIEQQPEEERSTLPFRMLGVNLRALDGLVKKLDADNRSQLCRAALGHFFDNQADSSS